MRHRSSLVPTSQHKYLGTDGLYYLGHAVSPQRDAHMRAIVAKRQVDEQRRQLRAFLAKGKK